jgi:Histidine kinase
VKANHNLMKKNYDLMKRNKNLVKFNFLRMKKALTLQKIFKNKTINLLTSSLLSALLDIGEGTLKKENVRPQLFFWTAISFVFLVDTVVLQGFGFGIDDYEFVKQYQDQEVINPRQGIIFTLCTIFMGVICSYINLLLFTWLKHYDQPLDSERLIGYNFSRSYRFIYYLIFFFILGYVGSVTMSIIAFKFINLNNGVLFVIGKMSQINFVTPLRQMPECLIIMWSFLGLDFYLKSIKGQLEWRDEKEKMELALQLETQKTLNSTLELSKNAAEIKKITLERDRLIAKSNERKLNLITIKSATEYSKAKIEATISEQKRIEEVNRNKELLIRENNAELNRINALNETLKTELELKNIEFNQLAEDNKKKDIQQKIYKNKFDAHWFFNVLSNVYKKISLVDENAANTILKLSNLFRYITSNENDLVPLGDDIEHISEYIELNSLTCVDKVNVYVDKTIDQVKNERILKIERGIFDEFITNAFKYASNDIAEGEIPFIKFKLSLEDDNYLVFCVENTTIITDDPKILSNSLNSGLEIIKDRLNHLYPDKHELKYGLLTDMGRYIVNLKIRLNYEK